MISTGCAFLVAYVLLDVHYFIRGTLAFVTAKFRKRLKSPLDSSAVYGICLPSDADLFLVHMNNGRYLREFDFGRFDLFTRNGTFREIFKRGGSFPVAALTVRYRQQLYVFSPYKVVTTPLWWDEKFLYLDQRIVTLSDNIVRCVGVVKLAVLKVNYEELINTMFPGTVKPELTEYLKTWIKANELSSENMKIETKEN